MRIIVTGAAGFIGYHVAQRLLARGDEVVGIDSLSEYYDVQLKRDRLAGIQNHPNFTFHHHDLSERLSTADLFQDSKAQRVVHLAAQAGVRYSINQPHAYLDANLAGFLNVLEACRQNHVEHLVFASSSSVYGANSKLPLSVHDNVDHPVSLYAATKKSNELMAHAYSHLYGLRTTGLRFFTVYGPWGRPDMAYFKFTRSILAGEPVDLYNNGNLSRDFTYIDDAVNGVIHALNKLPEADSNWDAENPDPASSSAPYRLYNLGNRNPVKLPDFIAVIESAIGLKARKNYLPMQPGDVYTTFADMGDFERDMSAVPMTTIQEGIPRFVKWYREYYGVQL